MNLATLYAGTGRTDEAHQAIERALALDPDDEAVRRLADELQEGR